MKEKLIWAAEHWFLLPITAAAVMIVLSLAGVRGPRQAEEETYTGKGIVWQATPRSSCFSYVGYDDGYEKLALVFRENDSRTYLYSEFLQSDYQDFMRADSLGSYYNKNIKGEYPCERIDDPEGTYFSP